MFPLEHKEVFPEFVSYSAATETPRRTVSGTLCLEGRGFDEEERPSRRSNRKEV